MKSIKLLSCDHEGITFKHYNPKTNRVSGEAFKVTKQELIRLISDKAVKIDALKRVEITKVKLDDPEWPEWVFNVNGIGVAQSANYHTFKGVKALNNLNHLGYHLYDIAQNMKHVRSFGCGSQNYKSIEANRKTLIRLYIAALNSYPEKINYFSSRNLY